jgi:CBS domain-containing protein
MTESVVAVRQEAEFKDIVAVMLRRGVSAFPVLDAHDHVIGVVSEADLLAREAYPGGSKLRGIGHARRVPSKARGLTAADLMSSPAITIGPAATVTEAAKIMYRRKVKRLPVIDDRGKLAGIVSRADLLGLYDRPDAEIREEIDAQILAGQFVFDPREFTVRVDDGVVTISGAVAKHDVAVSLIEAIWGVAGVVEVRDRLHKPALA